MSLAKFRMWNWYAMDYNPRVWFNEGKYTYSIEDIFNDYPSPPMLFTWLKDKDGKDIYEWDILQSTKPAAMKYKVIRDEEFAWFIFEDEFKDCYHPNKIWEAIIIWNIYETAHLLSQE